MKFFLLIAISSILAFTAGYIVATQKQKTPVPQQVRMPKNSTNIIKNTELKKAKNKIENLQNINQSLSRQIEQMNLPIPLSTTYSELLKKIDTFPTAYINTQLAQLFDEEYINQIKDTHKFSKELVEIALTDDKPENSYGLASITFSRSPVSGVRLLGQAFEVNPFDSIYAHIAPNIKLENCIIKWRYLDSGNILMFKQMALNPDIQTQYIWMKPASGWQSGLYQLTIHDMTNNKQLIGSNTYQITNITTTATNQTANSPDLDVINDLILNGQAVSKSY